MSFFSIYIADHLSDVVPANIRYNMDAEYVKLYPESASANAKMQFIHIPSSAWTNRDLNVVIFNMETAWVNLKM